MEQFKGIRPSGFTRRIDFGTLGSLFDHGN